MDRRDFFGAGGIAAGAFFAGTGVASAAMPDTPKSPVVGMGRPVTDFGVEPNTERDQTAAMQKAIDEIAKAGQPVFIPAGNYQIKDILRLPDRLNLTGVGRATHLVIPGDVPTMIADKISDSKLSNFWIQGRSHFIEQKQPFAINLQGSGNIALEGLSVITGLNSGLYVAGATVSVTNCRINSGAVFSNCRGVVRDSVFSMAKLALGAYGGSLHIVNNRIDSATVGIRMESDGVVSGNTIEEMFDAIGIRLGGKDKLGHILCTNNMIRGCDVGIGISNATGGYAMVTINMIVGAKQGAIRALNGDKLTGKDLTQSSSESFPYIAVGGNVSV